VRRLGQNQGAAFDLVFLDPPYGKGLGEEAMKVAIAGGWISGNALIVWEENTPVDVPCGLHLIEARKYGGTVISFFER